jgi:phospholipase C
MPKGMENIKHLVVVMLENHSFDNLLGFLYADQNNQPPKNIPAPPDGRTTYDGLWEHSAAVPSPFWNPANESYFSQGAPAEKVYVTRGTNGAKPYLVPDPDPQEAFDHMTFQILGPPGWMGDRMRGFVVDYQQTVPQHPARANQVMECYSPEQVSVLSGLARNYAVCDAWFCSSPTQTLPNRAFAHAGTALGHVNNSSGSLPDYLFNTDTIFEVLGGCNLSWKVYNDSLLPSLTRTVFPGLWEPLLEPHFRGLDEFKEDARNGTLPAYSFLEPSFIFWANDQHPPHDVCRGELFLHEVWRAITANRKTWEAVLLLITYDEHGGCYDHVQPPPAITPDAASDPGQEGFRFDRYGVRVPAVLVSPYIEAGTVFRRAAGQTPYDHTSILATLRDWLALPSNRMLPSRRIARAPAFSDVLTLGTPRRDFPEILPSCKPGLEILPIPLRWNDLQKSMAAAILHRRIGPSVGLRAARFLRKKKK